MAVELGRSNQLLGLASIAYPYSVTWFLTCFSSSRALGNLSSLSGTKKLFVIGARDNFTSVSSFEKLMSKHVKDPKVSQVVEGVDHFWFGSEDRLVSILDQWIEGHVLGQIQR